MIGNLKQLMNDVTIERMEKHEYDFEHGPGREKSKAESVAFKRMQEYLKKLPEEEAAYFNIYCDIREEYEADRAYYLFQHGFIDGIRALRAMLKL